MLDVYFEVFDLLYPGGDVGDYPQLHEEDSL